MWIDSQDIRALQAAYEGKQRTEKQIAARATEAQALAKRVQFALHRGDESQAQTLLREAKMLVQSLEAEFSEAQLQAEASWRSLEEELLEAELFWQFVIGKHPFVLPTDHPQACIGALSDVLGEVVRLLVREAAQGSFARLQDASELADQVLSALLTMDGTGHARQKVDQARSHARKIEDIAYDAVLHGRV